MLNYKDVLSNQYIYLLVYIILIDIFCGVTTAMKNKCLNSHIGLVGMMKHCIVIILVVVMGLFSPLFNLEVAYVGLLMFFIVQYFISICESCINLGIPIPNVVYIRLKDYNKEYGGKVDNDRK